MRTMNVSEGIIASRRGCWRVQVGWHLDFESGLAGIGSGSPTIALRTKLWGWGGGSKSPRPGCSSLSMAVAGSQTRQTRLAPGTGHPAKFVGWELLFQPCLHGNSAANPRPRKPALPTPPSRTLSRLGPGCACQTLLLLGCAEGVDPFQCPQQPHGVSEASEVKSIHMEGQELRASPSCPHGSCARSPRTKLIRGLVRTLRGCSEMSWKSPGITSLPREGTTFGSTYEQLPSIRLGAGRSCYPSRALSHTTEWGKIVSQQQRDANKSSLKLWSVQGGLQQPPPQLPALGTQRKCQSDFLNRCAKARATNPACLKSTPRRSTIKMGLLDPASALGEQAVRSCGTQMLLLIISPFYWGAVLEIVSTRAFPYMGRAGWSWVPVLLLQMGMPRAGDGFALDSIQRC